MTTNNKTNESANVQNAQVSNPESPMMKQFKQLKEKNPNALLLFRSGDFYECFREDAKAVSEVCGTTLTFRDFGEHVDFTMFPHQGLDKYLPMLIRAGHRVAICDQITPSNSPRGEQKTPQPAEEPVKVDEYTVKDDEGNDVKFETVVPAAISEQPADEIVEVNSQPSTPNSQLTYSTYKTKKGNTAPQIMGFGGPDDPRWQSHKEKAHKWCSVSYRRDLNGDKVYVLLFGTRYMDAAKALCDAYNSGDAKAVEAAEAGCQAVYEQAVADGKARNEARKAEREAKKAAKNGPTPKPEGEGSKGYDDKDVAEMLQAIMAGGDIPESIKRHMKAA